MNRPMEVIRARHHGNGGSYTTTRHLAAQRGDKVLEGVPAVDAHGRWLPPTSRKPIQPARDDHGRFTPEADSPEDETTTEES